MRNISYTYKNLLEKKKRERGNIIHKSLCLSNLQVFVITVAPNLCILFRGTGSFFRYITELIKEEDLCSKQGRISLNFIINILNNSETKCTCFNDVLTL